MTLIRHPDIVFEGEQDKNRRQVVPRGIVETVHPGSREVFGNSNNTSSGSLRLRTERLCYHVREIAETIPG